MTAPTQTDLFVFHAAQKVGELLLQDNRLAFRYDESWLARADAFPISLSLPLSPATTRDAHAFFANLLPEGNVRRRLCQRLQLSEDNDIALLRAIGGDCAGALCIAHAPQDADADAYQQIAPSTLAGWARGKPTALDAVSGSARIRLSLAGAQDKLPVRVDDDGIWLPLDGAASTHLLKFGSPDFRHLPANETLTTLLARQLGLPVVDIALRSADRAWFAVVERYDRLIDADGIVRRTHQEDACQALGLPAARKYEHEGGPRLVDIAELLRRHTPVPALAIEALVRWSAFNLLAGNADAHGKNLSLLIEPGSDLVTLAPFYDLVCTRCYEQLDRNMAMSIGDEVRPGEIAGRHWMALGGQLGLSPRWVVQVVAELIDRGKEALEQASSTFRDRYGDSPALSRVRRVVHKQLRRSKELLTR